MRPVSEELAITRPIASASTPSSIEVALLFAISVPSDESDTQNTG